MTLEIIINQIFILFGMLALGVLAYKFHMVDENANEALSSLLLKVTMPCTLIAAGCVDTYGVRTMELVKMTVVFIGYYVLALLLMASIAKGLKIKGEKGIIFRISGVFANNGFIGIPLVAGILGDQGIVFVALSMMVYNLIYFTYGVTMYQTNGKPQLRGLISPANAAAVIMLIMVLTGLRPPAPVQTLCEQVGACTTPLSMMIIGVMLGSCNARQVIKNKLVWFISLVRLVIVPVLFMVCILPLRLGYIENMVFAIVTACPVGCFGPVVARQYHVEPELASMAVVHSTALLMVTMPCILLFANWLYT